ncbi:hypothetical protein GCM10010912_31110 [Paenibacillus albidus]|uniref:Uncharacterized protein n=1 Tax=Paenibacillus albidus TaxID=2041023 RepID=A0A917FGR1_9BACL|nr:hypothetical protein [Paenibacillus albidus]GGF83728.1 hypothetical protein GCM10010912_31110 [Paenibacillus albidus]
MLTVRHNDQRRNSDTRYFSEQISNPYISDTPVLRRSLVPMRVAAASRHP